MSAGSARTNGADDVDRLVTAVLSASRALVGVSAQSLAETEGTVTVPQFRMLVVLAGSRDVRLNQLAQRLGVKPSTAVRMMDRLVEAGLATRDQNPENRREVLIRPTAAGEELVRAVTRRRRRAIRRIVAAIPPENRTEVTEALTAFAVAAGETDLDDRSEEQLGWEVGH